MRAPLIDVRLAGLAISVRLMGRSGRIKLVPLALALARLLGLLSLSRFGRGPNDRRLIPDVERRGTCFDAGVSSPVPPNEEPLAVLPPVRFLLLIVTLGGMYPIAEAFLGDPRGGVLIGAGSFERADCTRCSRRCICAVRVRICVRDVELGKPLVAGAFALVLRMTAGVAFRFLVVLGVGIDIPLEVRKPDEGYRCAAGFGVVLESPEGSFNLLLGGLLGVLAACIAVVDASDIGGEGGVRASEIPVDTDLVSGGVAIIGEDEFELGESIVGEFGAVISVAIEGNWRFRSLSCMISASILRSDNSSLSLCVSIRRPSLSCSPIFISSSIITARSIATLYFDSRSSNEDDVFRACLSKSSFWTSMSRKVSCRCLFASRSVVISFCKTLCAAPASVFDCLYLA